MGTGEKIKKVTDTIASVEGGVFGVFISKLGSVAAERIEKHHRKKIEERLNQFLETMALFLGYNNDAVKAELEEAMDNPELVSLFVSSFREMIDEIDEGVVPVMMALCADYLGRKQVRDSLFRDCAGMLRQCTLKDVREMKKILEFKANADNTISSEDRGRVAKECKLTDDSLERILGLLKQFNFGKNIQTEGRRMPRTGGSIDWGIILNANNTNKLTKYLSVLPQ